MSLTLFEDLLKDTMGLDVASVGSTIIDLAVKDRLRATGLSGLEAYWGRVRDSPAELQRLIEAVVVPETWFFRDRGAFAGLTRFVQEDWLRANPDGPLRILSLPCSTGEEPYSMAMALLDAGIPAARVQIDAIDISDLNLAHARRGVYRRSSFRGDDLAYRDRHFRETTSGHELGADVRGLVRFHQGNMLAGSFAPPSTTYDVIFCRNLLIYFDRPTQARAIALFGRLLTAEGALFVGPSETGVLLNTEFVSIRMPMAFAFRRAAASARPEPAPRPPRESQRAASPTRPPAGRAAQPVPFAHVKPGAAATAAPATAPAGSLAEARLLADQGRFVEAARRCDEHIQQQGPSADAFYLLGLVRDASGNHREATNFYRKALYLEPTHKDALAHLAALLNDQGKPGEAQLLRARLKRAEQAGR